MLGDDHRAVLDVILAGRLAWTPAADLEAAPVAELVELGWCVTWALAEGVQVTLTPWAARELAVRLEERGADERPYWTPEGVPARSVRVPHRPCNFELLAQVVDPAPGPDEVLMDEWHGGPLILWGRTIPIDPRLGRPRRRGA